MTSWCKHTYSAFYDLLKPYPTRVETRRFVMAKLHGKQGLSCDKYRIFVFSVKDRNLFHRVDTIGNIFTSGAATRENITDGVHSMK